MKAIWNNQVIAESDQTKIVEGNHYFPIESVNKDFFRESDHHSVCPWKGTASYYHVQVEGDINQNAAWFYPTAKDAAKHIEGYVAFWKGVEVTQ
ncbi:MAG: DUF427 domain-containing protein [Bacteroidota bacterium]